MKDELRFDNPNNACLSLHILAERARTGDGEVLVATMKPNGVLKLRVRGKFHIPEKNDAAG